MKSNPDHKWTVSVPSGVHAGFCILGSGNTRAEAIEDAFGPKSDWGPGVARQVKQACIKQTEPEAP